MFNEYRKAIAKKEKFVNSFDELVTKISLVRDINCASMFRIAESTDDVDSAEYEYVADLTGSPDGDAKKNDITAWIIANVEYNDIDKPAKGIIRITVDMMMDDEFSEETPEDDKRIVTCFAIVVEQNKWDDIDIEITDDKEYIYSNSTSFLHEVCDLDCSDEEADRRLIHPTFTRERIVEWFSKILEAVDDVYGTHYCDHNPVIKERYYYTMYDELTEQSDD